MFFPAVNPKNEFPLPVELERPESKPKKELPSALLAVPAPEPKKEFLLPPVPADPARCPKKELSVPVTFKEPAR